METNAIIKGLRRIMIDEHRCFGCGHEHSCGTRGCAIMRNAADRLSEMEAEREKPLTAFLAPMDADKGLKRKFLVFKSDTGEMVENCFILRPDKDPAAVEALRAYAGATDNATLSADILNWVGEGEV